MLIIQQIIRFLYVWTDELKGNITLCYEVYRREKNNYFTAFSLIRLFSSSWGVESLSPIVQSFSRYSPSLSLILSFWSSVSGIRGREGQNFAGYWVNLPQKSPHNRRILIRIWIGIRMESQFRISIRTMPIYNTTTSHPVPAKIKWTWHIHFSFWLRRLPLTSSIFRKNAMCYYIPVHTFSHLEAGVLKKFSLADKGLVWPQPAIVDSESTIGQCTKPAHSLLIPQSTLK